MQPRQKQTARGPRIALILLAALITVPLVEIALFIQVGGWIGLVPTLVLIVLTAVVGTAMIRHQGLAVLSRAQRQLDKGGVPVQEVFEGVCLVFAGALLLTPGFLTDAVGAVLLLPPVRAALYRRVKAHLEAQVVAAGQPPPGAGGRPPVIEGEFEEVEPDRPRHDGGTVDEEPPSPPRGGWDRRP
jgi:UPF0716 protein FxsA